MPFNFPLNPSSGEIYSFGDMAWSYNGYAWDSLGNGPTGPIGDYVISVGGKTGSIGLTAGNGIEITTASNTFTITNQLYTLIDGGSY